MLNDEVGVQVENGSQKAEGKMTSQIGGHGLNKYVVCQRELLLFCRLLDQGLGVFSSGITLAPQHAG